MRGGINYVVVKLDPENDRIKLKSGTEIFIDTSYDPGKHVVRTGEVVGLPLSLRGGGDMPWDTDMELREGDRVVMYYLAVQNCLSKEQKKYYRKDGQTLIFIKYHNIYAAIRNGKIIPINGFVLAEPMEDPEWERVVADAKSKGIDLPDLRPPRFKEVTFGKIAYVGTPVKKYFGPHQSDDGVNIRPGDRVVMRRIRDIPVEYEYHAKLDGGKKYYRVRRPDILAIL